MKFNKDTRFVIYLGITYFVVYFLFLIGLALFVNLKKYL